MRKPCIVYLRRGKSVSKAGSSKQGDREKIKDNGNPHRHRLTAYDLHIYRHFQSRVAMQLSICAKSRNGDTAALRRFLRLNSVMT
ncbi:hypothetical protein RRG08_027716 [Elysia crispata]|uniref:Uncharacterized protein n=1 Tax=Elysia crispata TaxID=231223 RepID=A0AAE0XM97_9GAST|nr:hypothetical protein RRG08_027716 [Elysia crispata]